MQGKNDSRWIAFAWKSAVGHQNSEVELKHQCEY